MNPLSLLLLFFLSILYLSLSTPLNPDLLGLLAFKSSIPHPPPSLSSWSQDSSTPCNWAHIQCHPRTHHLISLSLPSLNLSAKLTFRGILNLHFIHYLNLSHNNFTGFLNPNLTHLHSLAYVDFSHNALTGEIPFQFFAQCRGLRVVSLANNRFYGQIPKSIGSCGSLVSLNLSSNRLSGSVPDEILMLKGLKSLDLSNNLLVGVIPIGIDRLVSLKILDFSANGFDGSVPGSFGELKQLQRLNLSANGLVGSFPESMRGCSSLLEVDFSQNFLVGSLPSWVFELGLERISISGNKLSGRIQFPSFGVESLLEMNLSGNEFSGEIPMEVRNLWRLEVLSLSRNRFSGSIPVSLGEMKSVEVVDLSGNGLSGSIPLEIGGAVCLKELRLEGNSLTGGIPSQIGNCTSLTYLILSQNKLTGPIPQTLTNLTNLQIVDISLNNLTGSLPTNLSNLPHLLSFNISYNHLSGSVPSGNFFNTIPFSSLSNNPGLCGPSVNRTCSSVLPKPIVLNPNSSSSRYPHSDPVFASASSHHKKIILSISAIIAISAAVLIAIGVIAISILNVRARSFSSSPSAAPLTLSDEYYFTQSPATTNGNGNANAESGKLVMFSGDTLDFPSNSHAILNKGSQLGRGGFGSVYKAALLDGRPVAIKKLSVSSLVKCQEEFDREIKKLGKIRHPNLVPLQGYYWTHSLQLLISEFVPCGSLHRALHESSTTKFLTWEERFNIILGTAKSLAHLHRHNVIHYNLKSNNVLINSFGEAKIGDYGLARLLPMLDRYVLSSKIQSALGYMAPEFACRTVKITEKCDVYGFGVLTLEAVTGRRPVEYMEDDVEVLCDVVRGLVEGGRVEECVDGRLRGRFVVEDVAAVVRLGLICTSQVPSNRPEMREVVKILEMIRCPDQDELSSG